MARETITPEEIISKLREAEVLLSQGQAVKAVCRSLGISEQTYYRWRQDYGGMRTDQPYRSKELEKENARLKKLLGGPIRWSNPSVRQINPGPERRTMDWRTTGLVGRVRESTSSTSPQSNTWE